jgi:nucleoside-diphosphate-sugar epimerase
MFQPSLFTSDLEHVLAHTRDDWKELRGQRLFLTGGTGFFGMWLIESFLWANEILNLGAEIHVLSRDPGAFQRRMPHLAGQAGLGLHAGSMDRFEFPPGEFSHVIHAATESHDSPQAEERLAAFERELQGIHRVLVFAKHCGARRLLLTSSGAVYGKQPAELTHIPEDYSGSFCPTDTRSGYGQAKRVSEFLAALSAQAHGFEAKIARCFAFVGPYLPLDRNFAIGNFLRDAMSGGPIVIQGDGTPYRSYLYAADLAVWLWTILFRGTSCRAYNVGSDQDVTIAGVARAVLDVVAPSAELRIMQAADPKRPAQRYVPKILRAAEELGLGVNVTLPDAVARTAAWQRARIRPGG